MKNLVIQSGHINIQHNSIVSLHGSTGAPGEQELTLRIANRLSEVLRTKGFNIKQTDANANDDPSITGSDWDLFLALHGDADAPNNNGGGCVGFADPSIDAATIESQRIAKALEANYFNNSGIVDVPGKITNDIKFYYMWQTLTAKTPCILVELGEVQDPHDKVILADTERVVNALARGICLAFNIQFDKPPQTQPQGTGSPTSPVTPPSSVITPSQLEQLQNAVKILTGNVNDLKKEVEDIKGTLGKVKGDL